LLVPLLALELDVSFEEVTLKEEKEEELVMIWTGSDDLELVSWVSSANSSACIFGSTTSAMPTITMRLRKT
jgi:hypothetical protein